jgi:alkylation response protein AidB-like acyl-CoA dehydrogenase
VDVSLTPEQQEWQAVVGRLASAHAVRNPDVLEAGPLADGWRAVLELGIPALRSPEHSGVDAGGVEATLAVEQLASRLSTIPVTGQAVIVPELLHAAGARSALDELLAGGLRIAPALTTDLSDFGCLGQPAVAFDAAGATHALMLTSPATSLVAVALDADPLNGLDLTRRLVPIPEDAAREGLDLGGQLGSDRLERARAVALWALGADLLGVVDAAVADAVQYAKDRKQFGAPIGSFQAVQHLLADAAVAIEGARSCVWHAAWSSDHEPVKDAVLAARTAKAYCSAAGLRVVEATVQVFGGIAITWEHLSHLRLRRVHLDRQCFGSEDFQYREIAASRLAAGEVA